MTTLSELAKRYTSRLGEGAMVRGTGCLVDYPRLPTGIYAVDYAIGGGFPIGVTSSIYGPPAGGKCCRGNTYIFSNNGCVHISAFSEGIDGIAAKEALLGGDDGKPVKTSHFYEEDVSVVYTIKNSLGMVLSGTPDHKIMVLDKDANFVMRPLREIKEGDVSCICRTNAVHSESDADIDFWYPDNNSYKISLPKKLSPSLARLIGYIVANGSSMQTSIWVSTTNQDIVSDIEQVARSYDIVCSYCSKRSGIVVGGVQFLSFVSEIMGNAEGEFPTARYKDVPTIVLRSTPEVQIQFLGGLMDCDSYLNDKNQLEYYTASEALSYSVQNLLLSFGIVTIRSSKYLKEYDHHYWKLRFVSGGTQKFLKLFSSIKYDADLPDYCGDTNVDFIPRLKEKLISKISALKEKFMVNSAGTFYDNKGVFRRFTIGHVLHTHQDRKVTYAYLDRVIENIKALPQDDSDVSDLLSLCLKFKDLFYFYSPIKSVSKEEAKIRVYDFHIPDTHLFISNGYISHNTLLATQLMKTAQNICWNCFEYLWDCSCKSRKEKEVLLVSTEIFDMAWAQHFGVDPEKIWIVEPESGEIAAETVADGLRSKDAGLVVLDSLAMLVPAKEIEGNIADDTVAMQARLVAKMIRKVKAVLIKQRKPEIANKVAFIAVNQVRAKIGNFGRGPSEEVPGGFVSKHDWHLTVRMSQPASTDRDKTTELPINGKFRMSLLSAGIKRKLFIMAGSAEFYAVIGDGGPLRVGTINDFKTVESIATQSGLIDKKGWSLFDRSYGKKSAMFDAWVEDEHLFLSIKKKMVSHFRAESKDRTSLPPCVVGAEGVIEVEDEREAQ